MTSLSAQIRGLKLSPTELDPIKKSRKQRQETLLPVLRLYKEWASAYMEWAKNAKTEEKAKTSEDNDEEESHELDTVEGFVSNLREYYDELPRDWGTKGLMQSNEGREYDPLYETPDDLIKEGTFGGLISLVDAEVVVATIESCRNPRSRDFPFQGDSMNRETVVEYLFELREHGLPFGESRCVQCHM